jgi:hypothetical protein
MARKSFLYYLFSKNKAPLYVDDDNQVQEGDPGNYSKPDGQPARLQFSPDGWRDVLVKYARNIKYWGLFRDMTVPMNFVGDGAKILRNRMWMTGVESTVHLGVAKLDRTALPYNYRSWYLSEINFSKYKQTKTGVQVEALEGGLSKLLKANENTVYEIPIDDYDAFFVQRDGIIFTEKSNFSLTDGIDYAKSFYGTQYYLNFAFINKEAVSSGIGFFSQQFEDVAPLSWDDQLKSENFFAKAGEDNTATVNVRIKGSIGIKCNENSALPPLSLRLAFIRSNQLIANQLDYAILSQFLVNGETYYHNIDLTLPLEPGERAYLMATLFAFGGTAGVDTRYEFLPDSNLSFEFEGRYKTTYTKELYPMRVFEKLVDKITGGLYQAQSAWLSTMKDISLTSGNGIRGISEAIIKTSLTDFFKAFNHFSIGLTVKDDKLIIEPMAYFLNNSIIADIGVVDDAEITIAEDISFNTIKAGYKEKEYNDVNGKYEFNQGQQWSTPITKIIKELDLVSPYRADPIGTELLRINYEGLSTTDKQDDNEVFITNIKKFSSSIVTIVDFVAAGNYMTNPANFPFTAGNIIQISGSASNNKMLLVVAVGVNIVQFDTAWPLIVDEAGANIVITFIKGGIFQLNRPAYTAMTGIPATMVASIYNVELSPKKALLNNGAFIRSILDLLDADLIKFQSADKNAELSRTLAGVTIKENENIQIGSLDARLFRPYYISFRTKVPINLLELINANPFGKIKFRYNDTDFYGFLMDGGIKPATHDSQTWKLLCAPENDMTKFNTM